MTKSQSVAAFAEKSGLAKSEAGRLLDVLAQVAQANASDGYVLPGLGKLVVVQRAARQGRNPMTGETIAIPAKRAVKFRLSKECKDAVGS